MICGNCLRSKRDNKWIEIINGSTGWSISQITTRENIELLTCDSSTLLKFRERRQVLHGKKYSSKCP